MIDQGLQYTVTTDLGTLTLNPTGFTGNGYYLQQIDPDSGSSEDVSGRGDQDGSIIGDTIQPGLRYGLSVICAADTAANRETLENNLLGYLASARRVDASISWTPKDGSSARVLRNLRVTRRPVPAGRVGVFKQFSFEIAVPRPYVEGNTVTTTESTALDAEGSGLAFPSALPWTFASSGGGQLTVPNPGSTDERPILEVVGPIESFNVVRVDTQEYVSVATSIAAGDYVEIDLFHGTIKLNGAIDIRNALDDSVSTLFVIPPGGTDVQVTGSGYDGSTILRSKTRGAWAA
jgi:hypothetical protein